jgi:hypothetical protein
MKLLLHIGAPRTGTTAIQKFLRLNKESLSSQGFQFLEGLGTPNNRLFTLLFSRSQPFRVAPQFSHRHGLSTAEKKDEFIRTRGWFAQIDSSLGREPNSTLIVSSEQLSQHLSSPEELSSLRDWAENRFSEIRISLFARRAEYLLPSLWAMSVRSGNTQSLSTTVKSVTRNLASEPQRTSISYRPLDVARLWSDQFGKDAVSIVAYPDGGGDVTQLFAQLFLDGVQDLVFDAQKFNESPSRAVLEAWRLANRLVPARNHDHTRNPKNVSLRRLLEQPASLSRSRVALTADQISAIREVSEPEYRLLIEEFGSTCFRWREE